MAELVIETRDAAAVPQLVLAGEFDLAGIPHFEEALAAVDANHPRAIVIDLTGLVFMDSSGLRALVTAHDRAQRAGRRLAIVPGPPQVRRVFEITQTAEHLDLVEDAGAVSG
jgi:anti-sigma B factor antagonist